ncbi:MAG: hypothetical protein HZA48_12415 [Planctomycetes bacterium]|nr:hypothetical protein [Planctomycetota bacterium]
MEKNYNGIIIAGILLVIFVGLVMFWFAAEPEKPAVSPGTSVVSMPRHADPPPGVFSNVPPENAAVPVKPDSCIDDTGTAELPVQQENENYLIEGRVADSLTKAPVHGALAQFGASTCLTDEQGTFRFVPAVSINIFQILKISKAQGYKAVFHEIQLQKGVLKQNLGTFYLKSDAFSGSIEGSIYDMNGLLPDNADAALFELNANLDSVYTFNIVDLSVVKTKTGNGRYCFDKLPAGRYKIRASSKELKRVETGYFDLAEGEKKTVDINLTSEKIRYAGKVTDQSLNPAGNAMLCLHNMADADDDSCSAGDVKTLKIIHADSNGEFEVFLNKEVNNAMVYKETFALAFAGISAGDGNNIVLKKGKVIKGYVLEKDTERPVQGLKVWLETDSGSDVWKDMRNFVNEGIFAADGAPGDIYDGDRKINLYGLMNNPVGTDQDGYFEFSAVPAGFSNLRCRVANDSINAIYMTDFLADEGENEKNIICRIPSFARNIEIAVIDAQTGESTGPNTYINANRTDGQATIQYFYTWMRNSVIPGSYALEIVCEGYVTLKTQLDITLEMSDRKITYKLEKDKRLPEIFITGKVYENNLAARSYNFVIDPQPDERIGMGWGGYEKNILTDGDGNYQFILDSGMLEELKNESQKSGRVKLTLHCYSNTAETAVVILLDEQDFYDSKNEKTADIYLTTK